jgi:hypothetical protein
MIEKAVFSLAPGSDMSPDFLNYISTRLPIYGAPRLRKVDMLYNIITI